MRDLVASIMSSGMSSKVLTEQHLVASSSIGKVFFFSGSKLNQINLIITSLEVKEYMNH